MKVVYIITMYDVDRDIRFFWGESEKSKALSWTLGHSKTLILNKKLVNSKSIQTIFIFYCVKRKFVLFIANQLI